MAEIKIHPDFVKVELRKLPALHDKMLTASHRIEMATNSRTIINVTSDDMITLCHALHYYERLLKSQDGGGGHD